MITSFNRRPIGKGRIESNQSNPIHHQHNIHTGRPFTFGTSILSRSHSIDRSIDQAHPYHSMGASQGRPYERDLPMRRQEREEWMIELLESEDIKGLKRFIAKETNQTYPHTTDEDRHTALYHQSQHGDRIAHLKEKGPTDIPSLDDDENSQSVSSTSTSFHLPDIDPTLLIHSNVADGYTCGICLLLIRGAVILPCRHEYCLSCVDNIRESFSTRNDSSVELCGQRVCPYCRTKFLPTDVRPSFETRRRLQQLELHCPNHSMHGCQWIGTVDGLPHHLTNLCEHESITCQRCGKKLNREQSKDHECAVDAMVDFESKSKIITNRSTQSASSSSSSLSSSAPAFASSSLFYPLTYSSPLNAYCLRVGDSFTILHQSVVMSSPSFIRSLLIEGCNPNIRSRGPLDISTHHQSPDEMDAVFYSNSTDVLIRSHRKSLEVKRYTDRTEKYLNSNIKYRGRTTNTAATPTTIIKDNHRQCQAVSLNWWLVICF